VKRKCKGKIEVMKVSDSIIYPAAMRNALNGENPQPVMNIVNDTVIANANAPETAIL
jgi:hypothetical protein